MTTATEEIVDPATSPTSTAPETEPKAASATEEEDDAAMMAAFETESAGQSESIPTTLPGEEDAPADAPAAETGTPSPAPDVVSVTKAQLDQFVAGLGELNTLKSNVKKLADDFGGRVGSVEHWIRDLRASTPTGQSIEVSAEDFKELKEEFPELTELHVKGLNRAMSKLRGTGPTASPDLSTKIKQDVKVELAYDMLNETYEGWQDLIGLPATDGGTAPETPYRRWLATQPQEYQDKLARTWNPAVIGQSINKFRDSQTKAQPPASPSGTNARRAQLASAVQPKAAGTTGANASRSEDDDIMDGFKETLGR